MQLINYFSEFFNSQKLASYILNIELSKWGVNYSIYDNIRNVFVALVSKKFEKPDNDILDNFQKIIIEDIYLNKHYKTINFTLDNNIFTIVPDVFFDKNSKKDILNYCTFSVSNKDEVLFSNFETLATTCIYSYPSTMLSFLINQYPEIRFFHISYNILNSLKILEEITKQKVTLIHYFPDFLIISAIEKNKLLCFNSYSFKSEASASYFIMNVIENFNLKDSQIFLQGEVSSKNEIFTLMKNINYDVKFRILFKDKVEIKGIVPHTIAPVLNNF